MEIRLKRFLCLLLTVVMVISLMPVNLVFAAEEENALDTESVSSEDVVSSDTKTYDFVPTTYSEGGVVKKTDSFANITGNCGCGCGLTVRQHLNNAYSTSGWKIVATSTGATAEMRGADKAPAGMQFTLPFDNDGFGGWIAFALDVTDIDQCDITFNFSENQTKGPIYLFDGLLTEEELATKMADADSCKDNLCATISDSDINTYQIGSGIPLNEDTCTFVIGCTHTSKNRNHTLNNIVLSNIVWAEVEAQKVAEVDNVQYESLQAAIDAAGEGETVTLLSDIELTEGVTVAADDKITLELNGKTVSQTKAQTAGYQMILNDGNLTIQDSVGGGKLSYTDSGNGGEYISDTIYNTGTLVINGGTIENLSSATVATNGYPHAVDNYSGSRDTSLTVNGGTIYCAEYSAIRMFCASATNNADLTINGGTIKGAVDMQNGSKDAALGSLTVKGGVFETTKNANNIRFANWNGGATEYGITASISGGTFNGGITTQYVPAAANWNSKIITGGTFSGDVSDFVADGYKLDDSGNVVADLTAGKVAKVGENYYTDLQEAIKAAAPNGTVEVLADVTVDEWIMFAENLSIGNGNLITLNINGLTINGNGHKLTVKDIESAGNGNRLFYDAQNLNINNLTIEYVDAAANRGGIGLTSGTISNVTFNGGVGVLPGTGDITITGCTFNTNGSAIYNETDRDYLVVTGNTFNTADGQYAIYLRGNTTFTDNTVITGKVNVTNSATGTISGNNFGTERFKVYNGATATISNNTINNLVFNDGTAPAATFTGNTLSEDAQAALDAVTPATLEGEGTEASPYLIVDLADLKWFRDDVNAGNTYAGKYIKLTADIDLNVARAATNWEPIGTKDAPFKGNFDGNGKTISNLVVSGEANVGFFGYITSAKINNLTINNATVTGTDCVGAVVGQGYASTYIDNCHVSGSIKIEGQTNVGGIVGKYYARVTNSSVIGDGVASSYVKGTYTAANLEGDNIGGIMGHAGENNTHSGNTVKNITVSGTRKIGGLIGTTDRATDISGCTVENVVVVSTATADYVAANTATATIGGLIGNYYGGSTGGTVTDSTVKNVTFELGNALSAGSIVGGNRTTPNEAPTGVTVSGVVASNITGATNSYLFAAEVGGACYTSLQAAIDAAGEGDTVTVLTDITLTETVTVPAGKTVTLDLNGMTVSQTKVQTAAYQMILNNGNLTIQDSVDGGKLSYTDSGNGGEYISDTIYNTGTLVINGGTIENLSSATVATNGYPHAVDNYSGSRDTSLTVNGGTIYCAEYSAIRMFCASATNKADLTINGGTIKGAVDMQNGSKDAALGSLTVKGGVFETTKNANNIRFANWNSGATEYGITASISGGTFNGGITTQYVPVAANWNSKIISGGTFGAPVAEAYCAEGYIPADNGDGTYGVKPGSYKAQIGTTKYETLAEAIEAAQNGETVTLLDNVTDTAQVTVNKSITLDLNGKTIENTATNVWVLRVDDNSTLTLTDSSTEKNGAIKGWKGVNVAKGSKLIMDGGNIAVTGATGAAIQVYGSEAVMNGGKITAEYGAILIYSNGDARGTFTMNDGEMTTKSISIFANGSEEYDNVDVTINGGKITSDYTAIYWPAAGKLTITGGELTGPVAVYVKSGSLEITGGTLTGNGEKADYEYVSSGIESTGDALVIENVGGTTGYEAVSSVVITGGNFISENAAAVGSYTAGNEGVEAVTGFISGGTFNTPVAEEYCAEGYIPTMNADGTYGVIDDPSTLYISNLEELKAFRDDVNNGNTYKGITVYLAADINLGNEEWTPIGNSTNKFQGVFDGQNHTISNLVITGNNSNVGLFGFTTVGEIKNLTINNAQVSGRLNVGVVAGTPYTSKYTNITVTGHVEVNGMAYVGGVGGKNAYADWTDITVNVDDTSYVKATSTENGTAYRTYVGGVIGFMGEGGHTFKNITSNINVIGDVCDIGGITGIAHYGNSFENVTFTGSVVAPEGASEVGGIAGVWHNQVGQTVTFNNVTSTGTVTVGTETITGSIVGGAYMANNETSENSGSLLIDGNEVWLCVAKIGDAKYQTLADAFAAAQDGDEVKILVAGTYALSASGKDITITGAVDGVVFDNIGAKNMGSANVTFNNVTFDYYPNTNYTGLQHSGNLTYNNCTINGQVFLYGTSETFNNCTFNQNSADAYNVWTYGAKEVAFNECTFNSAGKSVLIYSESSSLYSDVTVTGCEFVASASVDGKAAIEMDSSLTAGINLTIDAATTATGFGTGNVSGNSLWNNKKGSNTDANNDITVVVAGETVLAPSTFVAKIGNIGYVTIADAISAANDGDTVTIFAGEYTTNVAVNKAITVVGETDAEGNNLVKINGGISITADGATVKNLTASNPATTGYNMTLSISAGNVLVEGCVITDRNAIRYASATGTVTIKDSIITGEVYGIHFDGTTGGKIKIEGCTITGWTSFGSAVEKVTITDTTFADGNYDQLRFYQDAELNNVTFNPEMTVDFGKNEVTANFNSCSVTDGSDLTDVIYLADIANMGVKVYVDDELLVVEASVTDAEGNVEYYLTLQDAIDAAGEGETVTVLTDIELTEGVTVPADKTITLDLNGKTVSMSVAATATSALITNNGTLTIKDSGENGKLTYASSTVSTSYSTSTIINNGTLTVESGTIENTSARGGAPYAIDNHNTLTVNGGTITATYTTAIRQANSGGSDNTVTVTGGTISGGYAGMQVYVFSNAKKTTTKITGGTFKSTYAFYTTFYNLTDSSNTKIEVSGGTFDGAVYLDNLNNGSTNLNVSITDGTFLNWTYVYTTDADGNEVPVKSITGGTFANDVNEYCKDGYIAVVNGDGTYDVKAGKWIAQVGETKYESLQDAINAAQAGDTVTLLTDVTENVTVNKNLTIDGADKNYTGTMTISSSINLTVQNVNFVEGNIVKGNDTGTSGTYTIKNCDFSSEEDNVYAVELRGTGSIVIEGCTSSGYYGFLQVPKSNNSVSLKDVTIANTGYAVKVDYSNGVTLENVTISSSTYGFVNSNYGTKTITVKDCTITANYPLVIWDRNTAKVNTFKFEGKNDFGSNVFYYQTVTEAEMAYTKYVLADENATLKAVEGLNVTTTVADCKVVYENGTYKVAPKIYVAQVGETKYETLAEAVEAVADGGVIELLANCSDDEMVFVKKQLTIKMNSFELTENLFTIKGYGSYEDDDKLVVVKMDVPTADAGEKLAYIDIDNDGYVNETLMTLQAALDLAGEQGGNLPVKLYGDLTVNAVVIIPNNVTLDIERHTLTVKAMIALSGGKLLGAYDSLKDDGKLDGGLLKVSRENLVLNAEAAEVDGVSVLPIWDPTEGNQCYRFSQIIVNTDPGSNNRGLHIDKENDTIKFSFKNRATTDLYNSLMKNYGGSELGFSVIARIEWNEKDSIGNDIVEYHNFVYSDETIKLCASNYQYFFSIANFSLMGIDLDSLKVTATVVTDSGATAYSEVWTINNADVIDATTDAE